MTKWGARSTNKSASAARRSSVVEIPDDLAAAIKRCWPRSVVEEFDTDESYFQEIRDQIDRDLSRISGASLVWQTEEAGGAGWIVRRGMKRYPPTPNGSPITSSFYRRRARNSVLKTRQLETIQRMEPRLRMLVKAGSALR